MKNRNDLYGTIASNIRKERNLLGISQACLAERTELSVDTIKAIEYGRRTMSLDTYLRIVEALGMTPFRLMHRIHMEPHMERFLFMTLERSSREVEFVLHMVEQLLHGQDCYLNG